MKQPFDELKAQLRAMPTGVRSHDGQGYNFSGNTEKTRRIRSWVDAIERDPNYGRVLFRLPLIDPTPEMQAWADEWEQRNTRFYRRPEGGWAALA